MLAGAAEFFAAIWPASGLYCLATPFSRGTGYDHHVFSSIENALEFAEANALNNDMYFTVHTLDKEQVWDPKHKDRHGVTVGKWRHRTRENMKESKCFFFDLDVGKDKPYATIQEALASLISFVERSRLPKPWVIGSGGGLHVYWPIDTTIESIAWVETAAALRKLATHFELHVDPARTVDRTSVLRVPGTFNLKIAGNPRLVKILRTGGVTPTVAFLDAIRRNSVFLAPEPGSAAHVMDQRHVELTLLGRACGATRMMVKNAGSHTEPQWYAFIGLMLYVNDGERLIHKISAQYPGYTKEETDGKIEQIRTNQTGPTTCGRIAGLGFHDACAKCWYKKSESSPVVASKKLGVVHDPQDELPPPPKPFKRLAAGGVSMDKGEEAGEIVISPYDLYPTMLVDDHQSETKLATWQAIVPKRDAISVNLHLRTLQDQPTLGAELADRGIMLQVGDLKLVSRYMVSYIQELQRHQLERKQHSHLGWTEDKQEFILPHQIITRTGQTRKAVLSSQITPSIEDVTRRGTLANSIEAMKFYNDPAYIRHQFAIAASLAAPLFHMTGQFGVILNLSGVSGCSKSTALYGAASLWGRGTHYTINGTNQGMTANARNQRLAIMANLPICVDEITYMPAEDAKNLAMSVTQPQARIGLRQDQKERKRISSLKSTIMICSSNGSLHEKLSVQNVAGTASSMRVMELMCQRLNVHTKTDADNFLREIDAHHGHIGPAFMEFILTNLHAVEEDMAATMAMLDRSANISQEERYWVALIAAVLVALRWACRAGLLSYNAMRLQEWIIKEQLGQLRATVSDNYADPLDAFMAYLNASAQDTLIVEAARNGGGFYAQQKPSRELGIRYERDTRQVFISLAHLKHYCSRRSVQMVSMMAALEKAVAANKLKMSLGRGIPDWNFGQTRVLHVDMRAPEFAGLELDVDKTNVVEFPNGTRNETENRDQKRS